MDRLLWVISEVGNSFIHSLKGQQCSCVIWPSLNKWEWDEWELLEISSCAMILVSGYIHTRLTYPPFASHLEVIVFSMFFPLQTVQQGYFWLSPACRGNASQCIPYFSPFIDWLDPIITQKAVVWNIPLAVAGANASLTCNEGCGFDPNMCCKSWWHFKRYLFGICLQQQESKWGKCERFRTPWKLNKIPGRDG